MAEQMRRRRVVRQEPSDQEKLDAGFTDPLVEASEHKREQDGPALASTMPPPGLRFVGSGTCATAPDLSSAAQQQTVSDDFPHPWSRIVDATVRLDVNATFARLERDLMLGDGVSDYSTAIRALDASARNLYDAGRLARAAKIADEAHELEANKQTEVLRTRARQELDAEKSAGQRSKAPTIQDVEDRILANWPDRVSALKRRRSEMHGMLRSVEALEGAWQARCGALKSLVDRFRVTGG